MPDAGPFPVPPGGMNPNQPRNRRRRRKYQEDPVGHMQKHARKLRRRKRTAIAGTD